MPMKHFSSDPALAVDQVRSPRAKAGAMLIEVSTLFGRLVLATMVAVSPLAIRFMIAG